MLSRSTRLMLLVLFLLFVGLLTADALGVFSDAPYTAVPHGNHAHYVPRGCEDVNIGDFPTVEPGPDERITCDGQIVTE